MATGAARTQGYATGLGPTKVESVSRGDRIGGAVRLGTRLPDY